MPTISIPFSIPKLNSVSRPICGCKSCRDKHEGDAGTLYNLGKDETKALAVHEAVMNSREDNWRGHPQKERKIKIEISNALPESSDGLKDLFEIIKNQHEY